MLPTLDLRRLARRVITGSQQRAPETATLSATRPTPSLKHALTTPDPAMELNEAVATLLDGQAFENAFLSSGGDPDEELVRLCHAASQVSRVFVWGRNAYPFHVEVLEKERVARVRDYPEWWSDKIIWLPEDIEAVPRVVDFLVMDHSPWTCRFAQPRCCILTGSAMQARPDEDYRWTEGNGWLLGMRSRPRSRQAMNYRTMYSVNGGAANEDPFGWF